MRKFLKYAVITLGSLLLLAGLILFGTWRASKHEADWYVEAVTVEQPEARREREQAGEDFERQALDLRNEARRSGHWEAVFSDAHINGWLASDLKEKFPKMLPPAVKQPRVKFEQDQARVAFRIITPQVDSVIVVAVDMYLTEVPNQLAVRCRSAHAGLVPVPMKRLTDIVTQAAHKTNVPITWAQNDGDPVALIQIPEQVKQVEGRLILEQIEVRDHEVYLSGRTIKADGSGIHNNVKRVIVSQVFRSETLQR